MSTYLFKIGAWIQSLPLVPDRLRPALLRSLGLKIGANVWLPSGIFFGSSRVTMEDGSAISVGTFVDGSAHVFIGERARVGPHVKLLTGTHSIQHSVYRRKLGDHLNEPIRIERGCWIGMGVIIMPGLTIAEGCIIAAGSVVIRTTEPNGLYAGNPATLKRQLPLDYED